MPLFTWSDRFSVNSQEMDQQHKKIIGLINLLHGARQANKDQEVVSKVLNELVDYTKSHFKREEELMEQTEYPCSTSHKSEHKDLVHKALDMQKKYYFGDTVIATDVAILLNDWLADHILIKDKGYSPYINDISVNIQELDQQHKKLLDLAAVFCKSKKSHIKQEELNRILDELADYTEKHLKREEELMKQCEYPDFADHKLDHENFALQVLNIRKKHIAGYKNIAVDIEILLNSKLANHVITMDKKYGHYLNNEGIT